MYRVEGKGKKVMLQQSNYTLPFVCNWHLEFIQLPGSNYCPLPESYINNLLLLKARYGFLSCILGTCNTVISPTLRIKNILGP